MALAQLPGEALGHVHVVVGVLVGNRRHLAQLGAGDAQEILLLLALGIGDDDDGAIAARAGDQGEADAGVAGGALDDDAARPQRAALLGVLDDGPGGAVLHRAAGVLELRLAEDLAAGLLRQPAQADEGGVADRADKTVADVHGSGFLAEVSGLRRRLRTGGGARPARLAAPAARKSTRLNYSH